MSFAVVGTTAVVAGAGVSAYGAYQSGKGSGQSRSTGEIGSLPYREQLRQASRYAKEQDRLNRQQADTSLEYYPQIAGAQRKAAMRAAELTPRYGAIERAEATRQRGYDLADLERFGPGYAQALGQISPAYAALLQSGGDSTLLDALNAQALGAGPGALRQELERQAMAELQLGGQLSPEEMRIAQQSARAAFSDRGTLYGNPAIFAEGLNRDYLARQRQQERRAFAGQTAQLGMAEDAANRQFGLGTQAANRDWRQTLAAVGNQQLAPVLSFALQRPAIGPMQSIGASYGATPSPASYGAMIASAPQIAQGVQSLTPLYSYGADVYGTNYNAAESRAQNQAAAIGAIGGGLMGLGGSLAGMGGTGGGAGPYGSTYMGTYNDRPVYRPTYA